MRPLLLFLLLVLPVMGQDIKATIKGPTTALAGTLVFLSHEDSVGDNKVWIIPGRLEVAISFVRSKRVLLDTHARKVSVWIDCCRQTGKHHVQLAHNKRYLADRSDTSVSTTYAATSPAASSASGYISKLRINSTYI